jgi:Asp-tRNA(Asn)/Glu-tRNA(Gln) amidotransferase A subunit family amidase
LRLAVKDVVAVAGRPRRAGSATRQGASPEPSHAPIVARLLASGARLVGTTRLHELAFGVTGVNRFEGTVANPVDPGRIPGGSSSGSAAAVALGLADVAIATDTGGSARIPAALCGVVGFKASRRLPTDGVLPLAPTLDHLGWCAASVATVARTADAAGLLSHPSGPLSRRVGVPVQALDDSAPEVEAAVAGSLDALRAAGFTVCEVDWPHAPLIHAVSTTIMFAEAARSCLFALDAADELGDDVRTRLERGRAVSASAYLAALDLRRRLAADAGRLLGDRDAVVTPTTAVVAPGLADAGRVQVAAALVRHTRLDNLTGLPSISIPVPREVGALPVGLQLTALTERRLLDCAAAVESALR